MLTEPGPMEEIFFNLFSVLTLAGAILVVTSRNAVNSAMFLIVAFLGMACLFVLLESYFLAVIQVLVYAGAVVVLFLFIVMLLDVKGGVRAPFRVAPALAALIAFGLLMLGVTTAVNSGSVPEIVRAEPAVGASLKNFGYSLFTTYLLPMQVTGFLLLVSMIGVIVLSKRFDSAAGKDAPKSEGGTK